MIFRLYHGLVASGGRLLLHRREQQVSPEKWLRCRHSILPWPSSSLALWVGARPRACSSATALAETGIPSLRKSRSQRRRERAADLSVTLDVPPTEKLAAAGRKREAPRPHKQTRKMKKQLRGFRFFELTSQASNHSDLPFEFRYSYTEIPKVAPVGFQAKFSPFGPGRLDRPWDGQAALPLPSPSSEASFQDTESSVPEREDIGNGILGKPLTEEEITELITQNYKTRKQINLGRDGLTHNMLIGFHDYWNKDRVIRVKCKGVSTVDMENIIFQIEDKTGGKVVQRVGGTLFVFRGRNYDRKNRPNIPLMLWRPHSPIYPNLIPDKPGGLKVQEANLLRRRGREMMPLCKLAKNGYYGELVRHVKEAFGDDDLVRIECVGLERSDYKKIGSKLRDLVPCVLVSVKGEHLLLWKGRNQGGDVVTECKESHMVDGDTNKTDEVPTEDSDGCIKSCSHDGESPVQECDITDGESCQGTDPSWNIRHAQSVGQQIFLTVR